jgi:glycine cleavage system H protein
MDNYKLPDNLLYNQDYSWVRVEGDIATLGVIKPATDKVKEFVFVKLPKSGQILKAKEIYVSVEALKWSGHLGSPLSGEISEVNDELFDDPAIINRDPYGQGWIAKLKISNQAEVNNLINAEEAGIWFNSASGKTKK